MATNTHDDRHADSDDQPLLAQPQDHVTGEILRRKVWRRANVENQHFVGVLVGREGSGKSHSALRICEAADASFHADRVYFDPANFVEDLRGGEVGEGDAVMLDESGVGLGNRTWYEQSQVLFNQLLQTIRDNNLIILLTLPRLNELDKQARGRLHAVMEADTLEPGERATWRFKNVDPGRVQKDDIYYKYPRLRINNRLRVVTRISIGPPSEDLAAAYEKRKAEFKQSLMEETLEALNSAGESDANAKDVEREREVVDDLLDEDDTWRQYVDEHGANGREYIDHQLISLDYPDLSGRAARRVKKAVEREVELGD